jgi:hypothetical protein
MEKVSIDSIFLAINQPILYRQRRSWPAMGPRRILREAKMLLYVLDNSRPYMQTFVSALMIVIMWQVWLCVNCGV